MLKNERRARCIALADNTSELTLLILALLIAMLAPIYKAYAAPTPLSSYASRFFAASGAEFGASSGCVPGFGGTSGPFLTIGTPFSGGGTGSWAMFNNSTLPSMFRIVLENGGITGDKLGISFALGRDFDGTGTGPKEIFVGIPGDFARGAVEFYCSEATVLNVTDQGPDDVLSSPPNTEFSNSNVTTHPLLDFYRGEDGEAGELGKECVCRRGRQGGESSVVWLRMELLTNDAGVFQQFHS